MKRPLEKPITYLITKGDADFDNFKSKKNEILGLIGLAAEAGISLVQIREKNLSARSLFVLTQEAVEITRKSRTRILVNGRADVALAAGADGVHLPADGLPANVIRRSFPPDFLIGVSTHSVEEALNARSNEADFVTFGPVFESPGKGKPQGLEILNGLSASLQPFPVIALGGIDESNYASVLKSEASGFAAIRFLNKENSLRELFPI